MSHQPTAVGESILKEIDHCLPSPQPKRSLSFSHSSCFVFFVVYHMKCWVCSLYSTDLNFHSIGMNKMSLQPTTVWESILQEIVHCLPSSQPKRSLSFSHSSCSVICCLSYEMLSVLFIFLWIKRSTWNVQCVFCIL